MLAVLNSLHNVSKLGVNIGSSTHTLQNTPCLLHLASVHQTVGSIRDDEGSQEENQGWHNGQTHREAPAVRVHVLGAVVDPLSNPDSNGGSHLEHDVQSPSGMGGCNLRKVQRDSLQCQKELSA